MSQNYSNVAVETTLSVGINASTTTITVGATTGFPSPNFTLVIDQGTASEELVLVTAVGGTTLTVTRGYDGTTGTSHSTGATVRHAHSAKDFKDSRDHEAATAVHGATGAVVGTTNAQTLTNKTISLGSNTVSGTLAQLSTAVSDDDVVGLAAAQTLTNKTLTAPAMTAPTASGSLAGFGGAWTAYTPDLTNFTATVNRARYTQIGKTVKGQVSLALTGAASGELRVSLPVAAPSNTDDPVVGAVDGYDISTSTNGRTGTVKLGNSGASLVFYFGGTSYANASTPFTWASGDVLRFNFEYEAA